MSMHSSPSLPSSVPPSLPLFCLLPSLSLACSYILQSNSGCRELGLHACNGTGSDLLTYINKYTCCMHMHPMCCAPVSSPTLLGVGVSQCSLSVVLPVHWCSQPPPPFNFWFPSNVHAFLSLPPFLRIYIIHNITAAEKEEDSGFGEAWREVLTKYLCKSLHRVMRRRSYQ